MAGPGNRATGRAPEPARPTLRLDKWLFIARFFRSRDLACEVIEGGHLRLNGQRVRKPGHGIGPGDVLTFAQGGRIRVVRVLGLGERRGPAEVAQTLYEDLDLRPNDAEMS